MNHVVVAIVLFAFAGPWGELRADESSAETTPKEYTNTLRWRTASEVENFGFDVYRGDAEDGPFERLTTSPLPGAGTVDEPQAYVWVDREIDPRRAYWYFVESISLSGHREKFTPVFRAAPKIAEEAAGGAESDEKPAEAEPEPDSE